MRRNASTTLCSPRGIPSPPRAPRPSAPTSALNRLERNRAEKRGGGGADLVLDELGEVLGGTPSPEDEVIRREIVGAVNAFLASLDERRRALFVRRYWYAESVGDLARRFGMRENAVSAVLYRIRVKLKAYLEKEGYSV